MATITLYAEKVNQMSGLITDLKKTVIDYQSELFSIQKKSLAVNENICNLEEVIRSIQASTRTQDEKMESLNLFSLNTEHFIEDVVCIDGKTADFIEQSKKEFYEQYAYLKPDCEKNDWEKFCDSCVNVGEWCKEHWKQIVATAFIVAGTVVMIIVVVGTGGMGLTPLLTAILTACKVSSGMALTISTVISLCVGGTAVLSTTGSTVLNLMDMWGNYSDNSAFRGLQAVFNWTCIITTGLYSIGSIYNGINGISNASLREYGKSWLSDSDFRAEVWNFNGGGHTRHYIQQNIDQSNG